LRVRQQARRTTLQWLELFDNRVVKYKEGLILTDLYTEKTGLFMPSHSICPVFFAFSLILAGLFLPFHHNWLANFDHFTTFG
jgi:hypothetical protein